MANLFQTVDWMAMECLDLLVNKLAIVANFTRDYEEDFSKAFAPGDTVRVKKPQRWTIRDGLGYTPQGINRITTTVKCDQIFGIDFEWDSFERAVKMERSQKELSRDYLEPAMAQLAQEWDSRAALFAYQNANNIVGTLATDTTTFDGISAAARERLVSLGGASDEGDRCIFVTPRTMRNLKNSSISYFNPVTDLTKQWRTGIVGSGDGFEWYETMSTYSHTAGTWTSPTVSTVPTNGANTITIGCSSTDTFNAGDVFTITNVNMVNPMTRRTTNPLTAKPFVVLQTVSATTTTATLTVSPSFFGPGSQYQNIDAMPVSGSAITLFPGTGSPNGKVGANMLAFTRHAFAWVSVPLEMPEKAEVAWQKRDPETGATIAFVRMFDPVQRKMVNRFDCLGGFGALYPDECAVRILGA